MPASGTQNSISSRPTCGLWRLPETTAHISDTTDMRTFEKRGERLGGERAAANRLQRYHRSVRLL
jgi:hypothetical protein